MDQGRLQRLQLVQSLLQQAPPGELEQVAQDLRSILDDDSLFCEAAAPIFEQMNEDQLAVGRFPNTLGKALISRAGRVGDCTYLDPKSRMLVTVNHFTKEVTKARPMPTSYVPEEGLEKLRACAEAELAAYTASNFPDGLGAVYARLGDERANNELKGISICISSSSFRVRNFINGKWTSRWQAVWNEEDMTAAVFGDIAVRVHYFEEGNMQLASSYSASVDAKGEDHDSLAAAIVQSIAGAEALFLKELEGCYTTLSSRTVKEMRRALPRTNAKFPWSQQGMRLAGELKSAKSPQN